jgi:hypothetical protein
MKLLDIVKILSEEKNVGVLYHFTSYMGMVKILNDGFRLKNMFGTPIDNKQYISLTRDKQMVTDTVHRQVRISIDGTRLSNRYQINPYADTKSGYGRNYQDEKEERVLIKEKDGFVDISNYILRIDIKNILNYTDNDTHSDFESEMEPPSYSEYIRLINLLPKTNIPFKIVDGY